MCADTIWSGARTSGAVSSVCNDGTTGSLANVPNCVVATGMMQSDNVCLSPGMENVSIAPGIVQFGNVCARNCATTDALGGSSIVNTTAGTSICGTNVVDTTVHTSTRNSVSNAMLTLTPAASTNLTSATNASAGASQQSFFDTDAVAAMSNALLAQQVPPIPVFTGVVDGGNDISEWLEQFELIASVCHWNEGAKLMNLVTRHRGEAYSFYKSCTPNERCNYTQLSSALMKRFTPVRLQAV